MFSACIFKSNYNKDLTLHHLESQVFVFYLINCVKQNKSVIILFFTEYNNLDLCGGDSAMAENITDYYTQSRTPGQLVSGESPFKHEFEQFMNENPGRGTLKVQVSAAREAFPIKDVVVDVAVIHNGKRYTLYNDLTNLSGIVDRIVLPANSLENSLNSSTVGNGETQYLVSLYHPSFLPLNNIVVTIYDKVETILPVALTPTSRDEVQG